MVGTRITAPTESIKGPWGRFELASSRRTDRKNAAKKRLMSRILKNDPINGTSLKKCRLGSVLPPVLRAVLKRGAFWTSQSGGDKSFLPRGAGKKGRETHMRLATKGVCRPAVEFYVRDGFFTKPVRSDGPKGENSTMCASARSLGRGFRKGKGSSPTPTVCAGIILSVRPRGKPRNLTGGTSERKLVPREEHSRKTQN